MNIREINLQFSFFFLNLSDSQIGYVGVESICFEIDFKFGWIKKWNLHWTELNSFLYKQIKSFKQWYIEIFFLFNFEVTLYAYFI